MSFRISDYTGHYPALIKLGLPILVSQLGMIVVGFADNIMVGHYSTPHWRQHRLSTMCSI